MGIARPAGSIYTGVQLLAVSLLAWPWGKGGEGASAAANINTKAFGGLARGDNSPSNTGETLLIDEQGAGLPVTVLSSGFASPAGSAFPREKGPFPTSHANDGAWQFRGPFALDDDTPTKANPVSIEHDGRAIDTTNEAGTIPWDQRLFNYSQPDHIVPVQDCDGSNKKLIPRGHSHHKQGKRETKIILTNATPYTWRRSTVHANQVGGNWEEMWPLHIYPGEAVTQVAQRHRGRVRKDARAEVVYRLQGTSEPMSFEVRYRGGHKRNVAVHFREDLTTMNNEKGSQIDLGYYQYPSGVAFVLAGKEGELVSNNPPAAWMQAQLPYIGNLTLRELVLPRSHHAGMWRVDLPINSGRSANTQTQSLPLDRQLSEAGVRVLDARPVLFDGRPREAHGSRVWGAWHGAIGPLFREMVDMVNGFNERHPGELVIWDIHPTDAWVANKNFAAMNDGDRETLFEELKRLKHRVAVPDDEDVTKWPLHRFIGNGTSAVLIRFDESWRRKPDGGHAGPTGGHEGFVTSGIQFPLTHHWSEMTDPEPMFRDQVKALRHAHPPGSRSSLSSAASPPPLHNADWLLTQKGLEALLAPTSLRDMARATWPGLWEELWRATTAETYPNWVAVDGVEGSTTRELAMAMNQCLGARRCGGLGGKVRNGG